MNHYSGPNETVDYSTKLTIVDWEGPVSPALFLRLSQARWTEHEIKSSMLLPRLDNESSLEHELRQIPARILLLKALHFYSKFGPEKAYSQFYEECRYYIDSKIQSQLVLLSQSIQTGNLVYVPVQIEQIIRQISLELPFKWLNREESYPLLAPLFNKKEKIEHFIALIDGAILNVCEKANPGVIVEDYVHQELKKVPSLLRALPDIRPITIVKYLNRTEIVNFIHQKVLRTRANHCLPYLKPTDQELKKLRQELRKITVYRVRRNLIETLFNDVKVSIQSRYINEEQEKILLFLQNEFVRTLSVEIDKVEYNRMKAFLEGFKKNPVLQPLPAKSFFSSKNDLAQKELTLLIQNIEAPDMRGFATEPKLYDIDCPIEVDVLGEIVKELIDQTTHSEEDSKEVLSALKSIQQTYKKIQSVYFAPEPLLPDLIEHETQYSLMRERIMQEKSLFVRRFIISNLYSMAKLRLIDEQSKLRKLREFLLTLYFEVLQEELEKTIIENDREKYLCYESVIQPAYQTELLKDSQAELSTKRCYDGALKLILSK